MPQLRCGCGSPINLFKGLKDLADTELISESANTELDKNNLEKAQDIYTELLKKLDAVIAPPYPVRLNTVPTITTTNNYFPGLLQDSAEYMEVYLDEVW